MPDYIDSVGRLAFGVAGLSEEVGRPTTGDVHLGFVLEKGARSWKFREWYLLGVVSGCDEDYVCV